MGLRPLADILAAIGMTKSSYWATRNNGAILPSAVKTSPRLNGPGYEGLYDEAAVLEAVRNYKANRKRRGRRKHEESGERGVSMREMIVSRLSEHPSDRHGVREALGITGELASEFEFVFNALVSEGAVHQLPDSEKLGLSVYHVSKTVAPASPAPPAVPEVAPKDPILELLERANGPMKQTRIMRHLGVTEVEFLPKITALKEQGLVADLMKEAEFWWELSAPTSPPAPAPERAALDRTITLIPVSKPSVEGVPEPSVEPGEVPLSKPQRREA